MSALLLLCKNVCLVGFRLGWGGGTQEVWGSSPYASSYLPFLVAKVGFKNIYIYMFLLLFPELKESILSFLEI